MAAWMLAFGDSDRVGVAGTLLGGVVGFLAAWIVERSRRHHEDAHRFEADRRVVYVRFLEATAAAERVIRDRQVVAAVRRERPDLDDIEMPRSPDLYPVSLLADEIQLLAPAFVYMSATLVRMALDTLDYAYDASDEPFHAASSELISRQAEFLRRAKRDLGTPTGVMGTWANRRYRLRKRLGLIRRKSTTPKA